MNAEAKTGTAGNARLYPWALVFAAAIASFVVRLGHEPLWLDESYSFAMVQHGFIDVIFRTATDVHPPLYYLALKVTTELFGSSLIALRLLSVAAAIGLIALGAFPVRRIWGDRTAYSYAILTVFSPGIVCFAQEARMYTLSAFTVTGATLYGFLAVTDARKRDFVLFGVFTLGSALTHYFGLIAAVANCLVLILLASFRHRSSLSALLVVSATVAVLYLPWLPAALSQVASVTRDFWIPKTSSNLLTFGLVAPFAYKFEDIAYPRPALVAFAISVSAMIGGLVSPARRGSLRAFRAQLLLVAVYLLTLGFALVFSWFIKPIFMPRYLMTCAGLFLLATAVGLASLPSARLTTVAVAFVVALGLPATYRIETETFNGPFFELAEQVRQSGERTPTLLHTDAQTLYPSWHALPNARHILVTPPGQPATLPGGAVYANERLAASNDLNALLAHQKSVWVVDMTNSSYRLHPGLLTQQRGWHQTGNEVSLDLPWSWVKVKLSRYVL